MTVVDLEQHRTPKGRSLIDLNPMGPLMAAAQNGDRAAYTEVLSNCQEWLRRYLRQRLAPDHVDDVVQEVLLALHRKRHTYDPERPFAPWFVAIARFKWLDRLRTVYAREEVELDDNHGLGSHEETVITRILLERAISHLPPAQAKVLRLAKVDGRSVEEISLLTGQSASLVKVNIHRARKKLISLLEKSYE